MLKFILFLGFSRITVFFVVLKLNFIFCFAQVISSYFLFENPSCFRFFCTYFPLNFSLFPISVFSFTHGK